MRIAQIADVHIRLYSRADEYQEVFQRLYKDLQAQKVDRIAVIGDIFHSKSVLSPEAVRLCSDFLYQLGAIAPTDVLVGNHDVNLKNKERLDSIQPILEKMQKPRNPISLALNSGLYSISEKLEYGVFSCLDDEALWPRKFTRMPGKVYVALFHGNLIGAKTEKHYIFSEKDTPYSSAELFGGYDCAFLGDIHGVQNVLNKPFWYCGSLIQQDFGEAPPKGYLVWDIAPGNIKIPEFRPIENDYGFHQFKIEKKVTAAKFPQLTSISKKPSIRVLLQNHDYTLAEIKRIETELRQRHNPVFLEVKKDIHEDVESKKIDTKIRSLADVEEQNRLIRSFLKDTDPKQVDRVCDINRQIRQQVSEDDILQPTIWRLLRLKWDNTFSYGSDNEIDFTKLKGLTGIFSPNRTGKSNFLDTILYVLFNKSARISKINDIINNSKSSCSAEAELEIGNDQYLIRRMSKKAGDGTSTKVELLKWSGSEWVSDNQTTRTDTDKYLRRKIGSFDDFTISSFSPQGKISFFLDAGQEDSFRLELLLRFLGLNIFKQQYEITHKLVQETEILLKELKSVDYATAIDNLKREIESYRDSLTDLEEDKTFQKDSVVRLSEQIGALKGMVQPEPTDVKTYQYTVDQLKSMLGNLLKQLTLEKQNKASFEQQTLVFQQRPKLNREVLANSIQQKRAVERQIALNNADIRVAQTSWNKDSTKIKIMNEQPWMDSTDVCHRCRFYTEADALRSEFAKIKEHALELAKRKKELDAQVAQYSGAELALEKYDAEEQELLRVTSGLSLSVANIDKLTLQAEKVERLIDDQNKDAQALEGIKEIRERNNEIKNLLSQKEVELSKLEQQLNTTEYNILAHSNKITENETSIANHQSSLQKMEELEVKFNDYKTYLKCIHREGIPYQVLTSYIDIINKEVDNILSDYVPFSVRFGIDLNKKMIPINLIHETGRVTPIELGSGMEKTISAIAIRAAFANIANIPHSNLFVVDESFGQLDRTNIMTVDKLLSRLKFMFEQVILVSHLPEVQDFVNQTLSIDTSSGFSQLNN